MKYFYESIEYVISFSLKVLLYMTKKKMKKIAE